MTSKLSSEQKSAAVYEKLKYLFDSAQGIWRDAYESQKRLSEVTDKLQQDIDEIKKLTGLPNYPSGMKKLQSSISRVQSAKKRIISIGNRLNRLDTFLKQNNPIIKNSEDESNGMISKKTEVREEKKNEVEIKEEQSKEKEAKEEQNKNE